MRSGHRLLIVAALGASVLVGLLVQPPRPLAEWLPERFWQVTATSIGIFLGFLVLLTILDLVPLRLSLFGSEVRAFRVDALAGVTPQLAQLQNDHSEIVADLRKATRLVRVLLAAVADLERRMDAVERGPSTSGGGAS